MMTTTTLSSKTASMLSHRGHKYATGTRKTLESVINNLWDPDENAAGFVSLGVAENVITEIKLALPVSDVLSLGIDARRAIKLC